LSALLAHGPEAFAVVTGLIYVVLIMRRNRWGFVAGALSSSVYVVISARARLPMQSLLQAYYVIMAGYGWYSWKRNAEQEEGRIYRWTLRRHLWTILVLLAVSALSAQLLARETRAAWPLLDSFTTWTSLLATWMLTRSVLENWLYWIGADLIMVCLFFQQGYPYTAGLFFAYTIVSVLALRAWLRRYRQQAPGR
jgi:nicotinamide mononucleotide transporter